MEYSLEFKCYLCQLTQKNAMLTHCQCAEHDAVKSSLSLVPAAPNEYIVV